MAGTITHSWKGTVLTITSDSGTSSMDLAGATGCRGPQGRPGVVYDETGKILIADLASQDYVDAELKKYDNKTLIRDEDGNLRTAVGGYIVEEVKSELVVSVENVSRSFLALPNSSIVIITASKISGDETSPPLFDASLLTEDVGYDICFTLNNGAVIEFENVVYHSDGESTQLPSNEYATAVSLSSQQVMIYTNNLDFWRDVNTTIPLFEIKTHGYCIYNPIDSRALLVDGDNITLNKQNQLTVGSNVVVESRMAEYVEEQIDLAQIGGDDPTAVLANYYTKTQVDARIAEELAKFTSGEEVPY